MGDDDGGVLLIGSTATLMAGCYGRGPRLIPETRMKDFRPPEKTLDRVPACSTRRDRLLAIHYCAAHNRPGWRS